MPNVKITIPYTPPVTLGTFKGVHVYVEVPDQSSLPTARMDGITDLSGSFVLQDDWAPVDLGKYAYVAVEQPLVVILPSGLNQRVGNDLRVYLASYSDELDNTLVRYGSPGATPSVVVTVPARVAKKPGSGSNVTTFLVPSISASVSAPVSVSGKLRRPISVTVSLAGLPTLPNSWAYQLLGFLNGDTTTSPVLATGIITDVGGGLIPAGPDGISVAHTFGPEEPTSVISVTIFAVAGLIAPDHFVPGAAPHTPSVFSPNNIIPGITASAVVSYGTTTGVVDPLQFVNSNLSGEFHIDPSSGKFAMNSIDFTKAAPGTFSSEFTSGGGAPLTMAVVDLFKASNFNAAEFDKAGGVLIIKALAADKIKTGVLEVGGADTGGTRVSRFKVFDTTTPTANLIGWIGDDSAGSGFVGAWFKRVLIGGTSPATAQLVADSSGNVAINGSLLVNGSVILGKLGTGTLPVGITYAGTVLLSQLGSGTLPVGVIYANAINVSQLTAGIATVSGTGTAVIAVKDSGSSAKLSIFAGALSAQYSGGGVGVTLGAGSGGDAQLTLIPSTGGMGIDINTFLMGIAILGQKVLSTRVATTPVTLADVIAVLQHHGLSN